ncbi:hypothetical protein ABIE30_004940, partial [Janthinobacterium lividum]|uniref:hypothetical protein n=1 Tax=Janthinobacterium lividum TaxID=29581 RepID=UPI003D2106BC
TPPWTPETVQGKAHCQRQCELHDEALQRRHGLLKQFRARRIAKGSANCTTRHCNAAMDCFSR